jgi:N-sulfoglucosamine sulfohydrolase
MMRIGWIAAWLGAAALAGVAGAQETRRPNILFAFADDWGRYASAYAALDGPGTPNDLIRTPNIDRLAREGALFRRAFVPAPSCTPCRSALLSGQYWWRTGRGAILQGAQWDPAIPAFPLLLRDSGYHIGKMYKVWSPGTPADAPFGGQRHAYERAGRRFNDFSEHVTRLTAAGMPLEAARDSLLAEVDANFGAFLAERRADQPFCFWFGPTNVHRKWVRGSGKALWGLDPEALKGKLPPFLPDVPEVREDLADYLGEAQAFDAALGVLLKRLEAAGELANTLIVVSGDHGAPGFPRGKCNLYDFGTGVALVARGPGLRGGRVIDDLVNLADLAPTLLEAGGVARPAVMTGRSLLPLLRSGKSGQVEAERAWVVTGRERHVAAAREGALPYPQRALRTVEHLYIRNFRPERWPLGDPLGPADALTREALTEDTMVTFKDMDAGPTKAWLVLNRDEPRWKQHYEWAFGRRPAEELYALRDDPHQVRNLAADPAHAATLGALRERLLAELRRTADPRVEGEGDHFERPPLAGPLRAARAAEGRT